MTSAAVPNSSETHLPFPVHRLSVAQYRALSEAGVLAEDDRVELLEGVIVPKMNASPRHSSTVHAMHDVLRAALPQGWSLRLQDVITTGDSQPEPDLAVVTGTHRDYAGSHPTAAQTALVVEVADSSLARDYAKRRIYSRAGIPIYWIVNLVEQRVEVYTDPASTDSEPAYRRRDAYSATDSIPLVIGSREITHIKAAEILP